ncbi:MAG TPA: dockerin type I domain-containing protein [Pirellulales bacterium]|jgi:hypothetical protein
MRYIAVCGLSLISLLAPLHNVRAVVISTGNGTGNTTAPANDPGFANVGILASGSAIYLGGGWVLTAAHVWDNPDGAPTQTWLNGTFYNNVVSSAVQLTNPDGAGFTPDTDLEMYRLASNPSLPSLSISSTAPQAGWNVTMIGNGRERTNDQVGFWTSSWQPSSTPSKYAGEIWNNSQDIRWGTNVIDGPSMARAAGVNSEMAFTTTFNQNGTAFEAQGTPGDSGGAVFHQNPLGQWQLAGVMFSTTSMPGQPFGLSVFGDTTISADLSVYRDEINQIMATSTTTAAAPIPGDVNGDGVVNIQDIAAITNHWLQTAVNGVDPVGDVNQDGIVNSQDLAYMASIMHDASGMTMSGVPEPASYALALSALLGLLGLRRCMGRRVA